MSRDEMWQILRTSVGVVTNSTPENPNQYLSDFSKRPSVWWTVADDIERRIPIKFQLADDVFNTKHTTFHDVLDYMVEALDREVNS